MATYDELMEQVAALGDGPGCYLYKDASGRVIYVGKAKNLRRRVASYFQRDGHPARTTRLVQEIVELEILATDSEVEALLLESSLIKDLQPRFNVLLKDGKDYPLLAITREAFPRVFITRDRDLSGVDYVGPFISSTDLKRAYHFLMRVFRFRVCDMDIQEGDAARKYFKPCLNWHIKRCSAPCTLKITQEAYSADIAALRAFLVGRGKGPLLQSLKQRMVIASAELRYEDAGRLRDQMLALEKLKERGRLRDYAEPAAPVLDIHAGIVALQKHLNLTTPPNIIEGFDIAHLQGQHVVASLVRFVSGVPDKDGYRRFKIRGTDGNPGNNDFAAMREVVGRRYRRLKDEGKVLPHIVLIDGGLGQVAKAAEALAAENVSVQGLVGLAKREETLVFPDGRMVVLSRRDPGLKLLQYVRDEAHRFCRRYYHLLQRDALRPETPDVH